MCVKIRLRSNSKKRDRVFSLVIADSRTARDGKYKAKIGVYYPQKKTDIKCVINLEEYDKWIGFGAQPTETVERLVKKYREYLASNKEENTLKSEKQEEEDPKPKSKKKEKVTTENNE